MFLLLELKTPLIYCRESFPPRFHSFKRTLWNSNLSLLPTRTLRKVFWRILHANIFPVYVKNSDQSIFIPFHLHSFAAVLYALLAVKTNHLTGSMLCSASHMEDIVAVKQLQMLSYCFQSEKKKNPCFVLLRFYLETIKHILKKSVLRYIYLPEEVLHFKQLEETTVII